MHLTVSPPVLNYTTGARTTVNGYQAICSTSSRNCHGPVKMRLWEESGLGDTVRPPQSTWFSREQFKRRLKGIQQEVHLTDID